MIVSPSMDSCFNRGLNLYTETDAMDSWKETRTQSFNIRGSALYFSENQVQVNVEDTQKVSPLARTKQRNREDMSIGKYLLFKRPIHNLSA